ncbi:MAG: extracellular solute-binding protein [Synergistaceae bacterium]|jgi:iron(III) transport system substrate-binding protein|nr:extracellular solute-binding protein [Synergistaceae bacterium]
MKKYFFLFCAVAVCVVLFASASSARDDNRVVIYSSVEDFREEYFYGKLNEKFPDYEIVIEYLPTGNSAAKLKAEGLETECDIVLALDVSYAASLSEFLADLSAYDYSEYLDELVPTVKKYMIWERWSGCIVTNPKILSEKGLEVPKSYEDLLKPEYRELIVMPNPKSSGTGYFFLFCLYKAWGADKTFEYFNKLAPNVLQFTASGSGPINALMRGEAAIGFGMTFQAVTQRNSGAPLEITYFKEGAPYNSSAFAIIDGKQNRQPVMDVFNFLRDVLVYDDKKLFSPEKIFKNQEIDIPNYPRVPYADMTGIDSEEEKAALLAGWTY